jgi:hypothetical protein
VVTSYTPNKLAIPTSPALFKYDIGLDLVQELKFTFDIIPTACVSKYHKTYEMVVKKKGSSTTYDIPTKQYTALGAVVADPVPWITFTGD